MSRKNSYDDIDELLERYLYERFEKAIKESQCFQAENEKREHCRE